MFFSYELMCVVVITPMMAYLFGAIVFSWVECEKSKRSMKTSKI